MNQVVGESGFTHSYSNDEKEVFCKLINDILKADEELKEIIPIDPETDDLFHALEDGIILCKLLNAAVENTVDFRAVNRKKNMNVY